MNQNHPLELLPAYSLGCLDEAEMLLVREHLEGCSSCRKELAGLQETSAQLAYAVPSVNPSRKLKERVLAHSRPKPRIQWFENLLQRWPRLVPTAALGSLGICLLLGASSLLSWFAPSPEEGVHPFEQLQIIQMKGTKVNPDAIGRLLASSNSAQGLLIVYDLPPLSPEQQYQLWLIRDGQRMNGGVFSVAEDGSANVHLTASGPLLAFDSFGVTIEPYGGSPGPTGEKVMGGKVQL